MYMVSTDPLPERENAVSLSKLLGTAEGRAKYRAWQHREHETWKLLKGASKTVESCLTCKGTGKIPLFTSLVDCSDCATSGRISNKVKQNLAHYIQTPEGRRRLAVSLSRVRRG